MASRKRSSKGKVGAKSKPVTKKKKVAAKGKSAPKRKPAAKKRTAPKRKVIAKQKAAPKRKVVIKRKPAPKQKVAAPRPEVTSGPRDLYQWEKDLRDTCLPQIEQRVEAIGDHLGAGDHNWKYLVEIQTDLEELITELNSPSSEHDDEMRDDMQDILTVEPSVSPDGTVLTPPPPPPPSEDYADAIRDQFANAWALAWNIYSRMHGTEQPGTPSGSDSGTLTVWYATDILRCLLSMHPKFLDEHRRTRGK
jgi:hypothetical protein